MNWNWTENKTVNYHITKSVDVLIDSFLFAVWMWKQTNHLLAWLARNAPIFYFSCTEWEYQYQMNNHEINDKRLYEKLYSSGWCNCKVGLFLNNLFGVDTNILSNVLAQRQECAGIYIIDADPAGFIMCWMSYHTTRCVINVIHNLNHYQTPTAIVSIDTEKAYKRIELEFAFETLKRFWFPSNLVLDGLNMCIRCLKPMFWHFFLCQQPLN